MAVLAAATLVLVALLLVFEARGSRAGVWLAKPLASAGFVGVALAGGALATAYGRIVVAALALGLAGDVLLIPRQRRAAFVAGIAAFLLGHVAFVAAFLVRGVAPGWAVLAALVLAPPALAVWRWLSAHVQGGLRPVVAAYVVVIAAMVALAAGTTALASAPLVLAGAAMFFVSDLSVARDRFVAKGFANKLWGLPLYYGGQLLLAASAAPGLRG